MNRNIAWKDLVLALLMIAVLCPSGAAFAEQAEKVEPRNFRFARLAVNGNDETNVRRYQCLWFLKPVSLKPAIGPAVGRYEPLTPIADDEHETDVIDSFDGRRFEKIFALGRSMYIKPGFGLAPEKTIENLGLEIGFRYLF